MHCVLACADLKLLPLSLVIAVLQLTALVLYKLLDSVPDMRQRLRAGYLVGNTEAGGGTDDLGMSHSVRDKHHRDRVDQPQQLAQKSPHVTGSNPARSCMQDSCTAPVHASTCGCYLGSTASSVRLLIGHGNIKNSCCFILALVSLFCSVSGR